MGRQNSMSQVLFLLAQTANADTSARAIWSPKASDRRLECKWCFYLLQLIFFEMRADARLQIRVRG